MKKIILLLLFPVILFSCKKDSNDSAALPPFNAASGLYISNEGNFQHGNASLSYYNPESGSANGDVYKAANNLALGDICQSMNKINGKLYLVVNNSGKIEICDLYSAKHLSTISGMTSPRYILNIDNTKAYVSDAYSNQLSVINLTNNTISGTIPLTGWTEKMIKKNNKVFVTNMQTEYVYIIDPSTDQVNDSIHISKGGASIIEDKNGKLWVLCGGDYLGSYNAALYKLDPSSGIIENTFTFPASVFPSQLCINPGKDTLYFIQSNIYRMSITDTQLPANAFITNTGNSFYGLAIDESKNEIYVSDAIDFVQKGKIFRYKADGTVKSQFDAGIIPGDFLFF